MKNLNTTIFGCILAVGLVLSDQSNTAMHIIGLCLAAIGGAGAGIAAKDSAAKP